MRCIVNPRYREGAILSLWAARDWLSGPVVVMDADVLCPAEMLRRLAKQSGASASPPTLMLLPAGREDLRREAQEAGARRTVDSPYDPVELLDALRNFGEGGVKTE